MNKYAIHYKDSTRAKSVHCFYVEDISPDTEEAALAKFSKLRGSDKWHLVAIRKEA